MAVRKHAKPVRATRRNPPRSLTFPADLWRAVTDYARARRLPPATAVRTLVAERLDDVADMEQLRRAREWQVEQGWAEAQRIAAGDRSSVSRAEIQSVIEKARERMASKSKRRGRSN